jgi:hypothetical protein
MMAVMHAGNPSTTRSLWRDLADGTAGWSVRIVLVIALGVFLSGVALVGGYLLAALFPSMNRAYIYNYGPGGNRGVYPTDEAMAVTFLLAAGAWLVGTVWLLARRARKQALLIPSVITVGVAALAIFLGILIDSGFRGDTEFVIGGIAMIAGAIVVLVWLSAIRNIQRHRPLRNAQDQLPDLRCPECGYRMVGLHESRCPECGKVYTLDEFLARQNFSRTELMTTSPAPPPVPASN